jgi:hypothetical protein
MFKFGNGQMNIAIRIFLVASFSIIVACGGGGGGSSPQVSTGVFTDSEVSGLHYETATQSGLTNTAGQFDYLPGETVSFSLGGIQLGSAQAAAQLSPLDLLGVTDLDEARLAAVDRPLTNILILLQSLDRDHNPDNGIDLANLDEDLALEEIDFDNENFLRGDYRRIVNQHAGYYQPASAAINHLLEALSLPVTIEVLERELHDLDGDSVVDQIVLNEYTEQGNLSRTEVIAAESGAVLSTVSYQYDENGNLSRITRGTYIQSFEFHPTFGLLRQSTELNGEIVSELENEYDAVGNLISSTSTGSLFGDLSGVAAPASSSLLQLVTPQLPVEFSLPGIGLSGDFITPPAMPERSGIVGDVNGSIFSFGFLNFTNVTTYRYDDFGNLTETVSTLTGAFDTSINTTTFDYEDNRLLTISMVNEVSQSVTEIVFSYDSEGSLESCERTINGTVEQEEVPLFFDPLDPNLLIHGTTFAQGVSPSLLVTCSESVDFDARGRISRLVIPEAVLWLGLIHEYTYTDNLLTEVRMGSIANPGPDQVRSLAYSASGQLIEDALFLDNQLVTRRILKYISLVLPALP